MNLSEWRARLQQKEALKAYIELQIESASIDAMRRTYEKRLEIVSQEIDCCITCIEQVKKREKFMKKTYIPEVKIGKIS